MLYGAIPLVVHQQRDSHAYYSQSHCSCREIANAYVCIQARAWLARCMYNVCSVFPHGNTWLIGQRCMCITFYYYSVPIKCPHV